MEPSWSETVAADAAAGEAAFADPVLIAEFIASADLAKTTRHKYERCVREFSDFLAGWYQVPTLLRARRPDVTRFLAWLNGDTRSAPLVVPGFPQQGRRPTPGP